MRLIRYGSRPHALGGQLHEFDVARVLLVTAAACYDDESEGEAFAGIKTRKWWVGVGLAIDRIALFVPWGYVAIAIAEPGEFDQLYVLGVDGMPRA